MKHEQLVIAINGMARSGKDTFAESSINYLNDRIFNPELHGLNISSVDRVKEILTEMGWNGEKDDKSRKALSDLKDLWTEWNDGPFVNIVEKILNTNASLIFVHIREPLEIDKLKEACLDNSIFFESVLIVRPGVNKVTNNTGDNGSLEPYNYTRTISNILTVDDWKNVARLMTQEWMDQYDLNEE
jgi:hypothetical protein